MKTYRIAEARRWRWRLGLGRAGLLTLGLPLTLALLGGDNWLGLESAYRYALVIIGFSIIIFVHELGHFIVARLCSVKCEVFSIGIGHRMCGYRKGVGFTFGPEREPSKPEEKTLGEIADEKNARTPIEHRTLDTARLSSPKSGHSLGETDYRLSWLPLGGYVRMLGQDDMDPTKISDDPKAFNNRPIWQRMCIIAAGVTMNLIFAFIIFAIIFNPHLGDRFPPAIVGQVYYDSPAERAGLQPGDRIIAIDGNGPVPADDPHVFLEFTDLMISGALSRPGQAHSYTFERNGLVQPPVSIVPVEDKSFGLLALGITPPATLHFDHLTHGDLATLHKDVPAFRELRNGDTIVRAGPAGRERDLASYAELYAILQDSHGAELNLLLHNSDPAIPDRTVHLKPEYQRRPAINKAPPPETFAGISPRVVLADVAKGEAGDAAGLKKGDVILAVGTAPHPSVTQFQEIIWGHAGRIVTLEVLRDEQHLILTATPRNEKDEEGVYRGHLGVGLVGDVDHAVAAAVQPDSSAARAGVEAGSTILAVDNEAASSFHPLIARLQDPTTREVALKVRTPEGQEKTYGIAVTPADRDELRKAHYTLGVDVVQVYTELQRANGTWNAMVMGVDHTRKFVLQTYLTLRGLFLRTVSPSQLHGIVGIAKLGHDVQAQGFMHLLFILAVVSVNLAVANFLPLPVVDGGVFLLLVLEKLRGKPLSLRVQSAIQLVGICLLAGLFIFVTYNDITMFFKK